MRLDKYSKKFIQQALDVYIDENTDVNLANLYSAVIEMTAEEELSASCFSLCL